MIVLELLKGDRLAIFINVVKASLTRAILGNILLVHWISMLAGCLKYERPQLNRTAAWMGVSFFLLAAAGPVAPAVFHCQSADRGATIERKCEHKISLHY